VYLWEMQVSQMNLSPIGHAYHPRVQKVQDILAYS